MIGDMPDTPDPVADVLNAGRRRRQKASPPSRPSPEPMDPGQAHVERHADVYTFTWPAYGISIRVDHLREQAADLVGEVRLESAIDGLLHWGRLSIPSTSGRETLARHLEKSHPDVHWRRLLDRVCYAVAKQSRAGEPIEVLTDTDAKPPQYLVEPLVLESETAVVYGDGGAGKSTFALAVAVAVAGGVPLPHGFRPAHSTNVLYLDWEAYREEQSERLSALRRGLEASADSGHVYYRRMVRALADDAAYLRPEIARLEIRLVIVDSLAPACGAEPETADSVIRTMNALRSFAPASCLVVAHVPKVVADQRSAASRPYGSVFVWNLARSVWELKVSEDREDKALVVGLYHRKVNRGQLHPPVGFRFEYGEGIIQVRTHDLGDRADLLGRMPLRHRIRVLLQSGARTDKELAEELGEREETVSRTLRDMRERGTVIKLDGDQAGGRGKTSRWGLPARE